MDLGNKKCIPCQGGEDPLPRIKIDDYLQAIDQKWQVYDNDTKLKREFELADFSKAIVFVNQVAQLAELEGHHPNIYIYDYRKVRIELWTHKINGLHLNDFILAAKIDKL